MEESIEVTPSGSCSAMMFSAYRHNGSSAIRQGNISGSALQSHLEVQFHAPEGLLSTLGTLVPVCFCTSFEPAKNMQYLNYRWLGKEGDLPTACKSLWRFGQLLHACRPPSRALLRGSIIDPSASREKTRQCCSTS